MGTVYRQRGKTVWMLKYYRDGRPMYESSGTDIKDDARTILKQREGAIADGRAVVASARRLRLDEALTNVERDYVTNGRRSLRACAHASACTSFRFSGAGG
jgi:hypothetical protein